MDGFLHWVGLRASVSSCPGNRPDQGRSHARLSMDTRVRSWNVFLHKPQLTATTLNFPRRFLNVPRCKKIRKIHRPLIISVDVSYNQVPRARAPVSPRSKAALTANSNRRETSTIYDRALQLIGLQLSHCPPGSKTGSGAFWVAQKAASRGKGYGI